MINLWIQIVRQRNAFWWELFASKYIPGNWRHACLKLYREDDSCIDGSLSVIIISHMEYMERVDFLPDFYHSSPSLYMSWIKNVILTESYFSDCISLMW
jgi:hypothetical protein